MGGFWQAVAAALVAVVLCGVLAKSNKEVAVLLSLAVCCMVLLVAMGFLKPIVELIGQLEALSGLDHEWISIVLKTVGIGMISQFAGLICTDAGNGALGKAVEILAAAAVLWLSVPIINALLELVQTMMGGL